MTLGTILIVAGVFIAIIVLISSLARSNNVKTRGGAVVIVGPFPIIFASDKRSAKILLVLSIILVGVLITLFLIHGFF